MSMTNNERAQEAIPHRDTNVPVGHAWFSLPRGTFNKIIRRELSRTWRNSHGFARAIESLRGLRLSLVLTCPRFLSQR